MQTKRLPGGLRSPLSQSAGNQHGWYCAALLALAVLLLPLAAVAQISGTGSIQGSVSDSTGALIASASVTITNDATQVKRTVVSGRDGLYSFPNIDIGTYTLTVVALGF